MRSAITVSVARLLTIGAAGCAPQLRAIPGESQGPIDNEHGLFEYRDGLAVSAVGISQPPIGTGNEFIAFGVHIHNTSQATFGVDVSRIQLGIGAGAEWAERSPVPPDELLRAYRSAPVAAADVQEVTAPELAHYGGYRGYYGGYRHYRYYYYGGPYYWPGGYYRYNDYYFDSFRAAYLQQQETAAFLARLLRSQQIPPDHVVGGFVVFSQPLHKKDQFRLLVPIGLVPGTGPLPGATRPATGPAPVGMVFEFHFVAR